MAKSFRPQHLELRYRTYFAVLTVPKDVQFVLGKKRFFQTTETGDIRIAQLSTPSSVIDSSNLCSPCDFPKVTKKTK